MEDYEEEEQEEQDEEELVEEAPRDVDAIINQLEQENEKRS